MHPREQILPVLRTALIPVAVFALLLAVILPAEKYAQVVPTGLTAAVVPADVASLTNAERTKAGLPALSVDPLLTQAAQLKAEDMAENSYYAHVSPDGKTPLYWLNKVGYKYLNAGENLVIDRKTSEAAVSAWMNSPDHRENILRPQFTQMGIGVAKGNYQGQDTIYVVQEFGTPYPLSTSVARATTPAATSKPAAVTVAVQPSVPAAPVVVATPTGVPVTKSPVVTQIQELTKPIVDAIVAPAVKVPTTPVRTAPVASSTSEATSTAATSTPVSEISYTLAPEFFAPISVATNSDGEVLSAAREEEVAPAPRRGIFPIIASYIREIALAVPRVWK